MMNADQLSMFISILLLLIYFFFFFNPEHFIKLVLSFLFSFLLGLEREIHKKPAGLRTHILVGVGTTIFTLISYEYFGKIGADPARIAAYILAGIGFIGGGAILKEEHKVIGLTTAASLWITAAIGMAVGIGAYDLALLGTSIALLSLALKYVEKS